MPATSLRFGSRSRGDCSTVTIGTPGLLVVVVAVGRKLMQAEEHACRIVAVAAPAHAGERRRPSRRPPRAAAGARRSTGRAGSARSAAAGADRHDAGVDPGAVAVVGDEVGGGREGL